MDDGFEIPVTDSFGRDRALRVGLSDDHDRLVLAMPTPGIAEVAWKDVDSLLAAIRGVRDETFRESQPDRKWR